MHPALQRMATELQTIKAKLLATESRLTAAEDGLGVYAGEKARWLSWKARLRVTLEAFEVLEPATTRETSEEGDRRAVRDALDAARKPDSDADAEEASVSASMCFMHEESGVHALHDCWAAPCH